MLHTTLSCGTGQERVQQPGRRHRQVLHLEVQQLLHQQQSATEAKRLQICTPPPSSGGLIWLIDRLLTGGYR